MEHLTTSAHHSQSLRVIWFENVRPTAQNQYGGKCKPPLEDHYCQHHTGEYLRAYESLTLLRNTRLQAARDLMLISAQVRVEDDLFQASGVTGKFEQKTR